MTLKRHSPFKLMLSGRAMEDRSPPQQLDKRAGPCGLGTEVCCVNRGGEAEWDLPPPSGKIGKCTRSRPGVPQTCNHGGQLERGEWALGGPEGGSWSLSGSPGQSQ